MTEIIVGDNAVVFEHHHGIVSGDARGDGGLNARAGHAVNGHAAETVWGEHLDAQGVAGARKDVAEALLRMIDGRHNQGRVGAVQAIRDEEQQALGEREVSG